MMPVLPSRRCDWLSSVRQRNVSWVVWIAKRDCSVRTCMGRCTRLSNGFSRKLENHAAATALDDFAYNFIKIHPHPTLPLRVSRAMAAGITDRLWSVEDLVALSGSLRAGQGGTSGSVNSQRGNGKIFIGTLLLILTPLPFIRDTCNRRQGPFSVILWSCFAGLRDLAYSFWTQGIDSNKFKLPTPPKGKASWFDRSRFCRHRRRFPLRACAPGSAPVI
jgi:hypothetical protein